MKHTKRNIRWIAIIVVMFGICAIVYLTKAVKIFIRSDGEILSYSEEYGSFTSKDAYSYDGKLVAHQKVEKGTDVKRIVVEVKDSETGEQIGSFSPARAGDFWGICWENDNYNIWTQSGDIGVYCWRYRDGVWECDYSNPERPEYIISKYDKQKE